MKNNNIKFNKKLYSQKVINAVAKEFKDLADIKISSQGNYFVATFSQVDSDVEEVIIDEFGNYALFAMKEI